MKRLSAVDFRREVVFYVLSVLSSILPRWTPKTITVFFIFSSTDLSDLLDRFRTPPAVNVRKKKKFR